jgi:predicted RNA methylase
MMRVDQDILEILERSVVEGGTLRLPPAQLDRKTYAAVNKVIEAAGGHWDRKARAHVFDGDAIDTIDPILLTGEYTLTKQDFGQFDSPPCVVSRVIELAQIERGMEVLEPSAGIGNIALAAAFRDADVMCYELDERRCDAMVKASARALRRLDMVVQADFLTVEPAPVYDRVVMNPPFAKQADIRHVTHAAKFLKPGGRLVSIMSTSVTFRTDARSEEFRNFINSRGSAHEALPPKSFKDSGTTVNAVVVSFGGESL